MISARRIGASGRRQDLSTRSSPKDLLHLRDLSLPTWWPTSGCSLSGDQTDIA